MNAVRVLLVALSFTIASAALSAPAPRPKPDHQAASAAVERLKERLRRQGFFLESLRQEGPGRWIVAACSTGNPDHRLERQIEARDGTAALRLYVEWLSGPNLGSGGDAVPLVTPPPAVPREFD